MDVNDSCRLCFGNLRIDGKLRVLASWEQHSAGVLRHRHERPPPFAPTNLSLLWLARTRSYRCKHSTEDKGQTGQTIGVEPSLAEARRMAREATYSCQLAWICPVILSSYCQTQFGLNYVVCWMFCLHFLSCEGNNWIQFPVRDLYLLFFAGISNKTH